MNVRASIVAQRCGKNIQVLDAVGDDFYLLYMVIFLFLSLRSHRFLVMPLWEGFLMMVTAV